ncbi:helix-turn-helix domain-containing protein [Maridesulfovibrio hydrothermalis]|uniref:CI repressor n=1 Tax=Maridesulfovibrio hydrothermalis AM13 = DSM 14728 TaxID=1121451 RepID=L0R678_9BACT|nr:helix-turn-helix domain-containing protein [Maridesulfovibrio hydrothermalis]CCO22198.1 CI repressor [Maridesulfovibrio hydrothermalis AM13 = DSM 14728]
MVNANSFEDRLNRIMKACGASSDAQLAKILEIKSPSVAAAKRRQQIPSGWIEKIAKSYGVCSDWLFFGEGPMKRGEAGNHLQEQVQEAVADASLSASGELEELRQECRELRQDNRELVKENRELMKDKLELTKENGDLRVKLAEIKARAAPDQGMHNEAHRKAI